MKKILIAATLFIALPMNLYAANIKKTFIF